MENKHKLEFIIHNEKDNEHYIRKFNNKIDCRNWIINTLDLSKNWSFYNEKAMKYRWCLKL